ncbi:MAG: VOC family protein [Henriciella sp.]|nr:VOC family protein [Henriciella sp.]MBO6695125.1 VOC family protein [Henriciella sp.]
MVKATGIHHIAIMSADVKTHIEFFSDVMGCKLSALFDMHGVPGGLHAFMHLDDDCYFSIVQLPAAKDIPIEIGVTHSGTGAGACAPGTMQHLAFKVDTPDQLVAIRDRIRKKGVNVIGPIDHGMCQSIYFGGPESLTLEVATSNEEIDQRAWIDPKVLEKAGINAEEAEQYQNPDPYDGEGGAVKQPPYDPDKPHQAYPKDMYMQMLQAPDEVIWNTASHTEPPVKV